MEPPDDADTLKGDTEHCTPPRCPLQADSNYWSAACGAAIWIYLRKGAPVARVTSWTRWRVCRRLRGGARRFNEEFQASVPADSSARRTPLKRGFEGMLLKKSSDLIWAASRCSAQSGTTLATGGSLPLRVPGGCGHTVTSPTAALSQPAMKQTVVAAGSLIVPAYGGRRELHGGSAIAGQAPLTR